MTDSFTVSFRDKTLWKAPLQCKINPIQSLLYFPLAGPYPWMYEAPRTYLDVIHLEPMKLSLTPEFILSLYSGFQPR